MKIKISYRATDGYSKTKTYTTLKGAMKYAHDMLGKHPDMGGGYAVSFDGVGRITVTGCTISELFPENDTDTALLGCCDGCEIAGDGSHCNDCQYLYKALV